MRPELRFKVVMIGDTGVGKTAVVNRMSEGSFLTDHIPTVGSQFITMDLIVEGQKICFELWDTAGQEVYRSLVGFYARDASGALIVADLTLQSSFDSLPEWVKFIRTESPDVKIVIFGNKSDLIQQRVLSNAVFTKFAASNGVDFLEGSAKTGQNVADAFEKMGDLLLSSERNPDHPTDLNALIPLTEKKKKTGCC
jgi:small GTP-binding protein